MTDSSKREFERVREEKPLSAGKLTDRRIKNLSKSAARGLLDSARRIFEEALQFVDEELKKSPREADRHFAYYRLIRTALFYKVIDGEDAEKYRETALEKLDSALQIRPKPIFLRAQAEELAYRGDAAEALRICTRLMQEYPSDIENFEALGFVYKNAGFPEQAMACFDYALQNGVEKRRLRESFDALTTLHSFNPENARVFIYTILASLPRGPEPAKKGGPV